MERRLTPKASYRLLYTKQAPSTGLLFFCTFYLHIPEICSIFAVKMRERGIILLLVTTLLLSCAPKALREAEEVVAQADSLRAAGQVYVDSVRLAHSYTTLRAWRDVHADEYAHACYHYGRLLREKDNPVEAMHCFIEASHTPTHDYHILGRVYSNMGSICHLANEFQLSYDMYEKSGEMFLHNGDSTAYFYALNDMAFELAEQGKKKEAFCIISQIEKSCTDAEVLTKTLETKAEACLYAHQYDSILYYTDLLYSNNSRESHIILLRAKAFTFLEQKDSAVYYANYVLSISDELFNKNSALYILTQDDESKDKQDIRMTSAARSDTQKLIEIRQGKLSQAVQLLEQDLHRKPNLAWLYAICATLVIVGLIVLIYVHKKRRQHTLLAQQIEDLTIQNKEAAVQHEKIINDVEKHKRNIIAEIEQNCHLITQAESFPQNIHWKSYNKMCTVIDKRFYLLASKLHTKYKLNETETRLCVLTLLDCKYELIADLLYRSNSSIGTLKIRVAKKIGTTAKNLRMYLIENECVN